jgi:hypothetical protein
MDLTKLADLKNELVNTNKFFNVWEHFLDQFGEDPAFIKLGERVRHPLLEAVYNQIAQQLYNAKVNWDLIIFTRLTEHGFIHGGGPVGKALLNVLYFEDIQMGMVCAATPFASDEVKFMRFSTKLMPRGAAQPSDN